MLLTYLLTKLTAKEGKNLAELALFACLIYARAWISCPNACDAPISDLATFQPIKQYSNLNKSASEAAMKKLQSHLWYFGPDIVPLALFSDKLPLDKKCQIIASMKRCGESWKERGIKLINTVGLEKKSLHDLITPASTIALRSLHVDIEFEFLFESDPATWNESVKFIEAKTIVNNLKVVNDAAERSVALTSTFNESITKNESELQKLIQVVEDHRKRVPDARKCTLQTYSPR